MVTQMPCRKYFSTLARNYFSEIPKISLATADYICRMTAYQGEMKMLHDFDEINDILATMKDNGTVEPIDEPTCHPMDWAEVVGIADEVFDEIYPRQTMVDEDGMVWYVS
jgi:hypothetical protein